MPPIETSDTSMSVTSLILNASLPVQIIMLILVIASVVSWAIMISKYLQVKRALQQTRDFESHFWQSKELSDLHQSVSKDLDQSGPLARIFNAGMTEFLRHRRSGQTDGERIIDGTHRAMQATTQRELDSLDAKLNFLASTGSVSPYIGLLGTVWGIMHSFIGLSTAVNATLAAVAPGIAEALIATAIGLFAAIPAVLGYNYFSTQNDILAGRFDSFSDELLNILQRQLR
ncbi:MULTISPECIES: protein TolQ [Oligella]|uniref:Tol-Pal system protein TolQ n=2 Tax=Oligella urethralis TaxID=90245 RepID=A0A095ZCW6_9BURK|nr:MULTISPECIES: protein TolQ [Oligella]AVL70078.1 protein TolQ [Oligella urethralis]KGF32595.1 protein tolQ [Oligella urethralis DNF00040]MDK6202750.1 protein TolQ [Oligella urethralis]OFS84277.1 protein TolQ [Oligella sp. HMSC05A10]OFV46251.1 protein TolQ [Oligella sp. HMSC09E12]